MVNIPRKLALIIFFVAGFVFVGVGILSIIDSNIPRYVEMTDVMEPNKSEVFTPDMNEGNTANIYANGSEWRIFVTDPANNLIINKTNEGKSILNETITAQMNGEYRIQIVNYGNSILDWNLGAFSKASSFAFGGQMMLIITGIVVIGLGLRARIRS
mgnify:CR=1 FL=1